MPPPGDGSIPGGGYRATNADRRPSSVVTWSVSPLEQHAQRLGPVAVEREVDAHEELQTISGTVNRNLAAEVLSKAPKAPGWRPGRRSADRWRLTGGVQPHRRELRCSRRVSTACTDTMPVAMRADSVIRLAT